MKRRTRILLSVVVIAIASLAALRWFDVHPVDLSSLQPREDAPVADGVWAAWPDPGAAAGSDSSSGSAPAAWVWIEEAPAPDGDAGRAVAPSSSAAAPPPFEANDWSAAWLNLLDQEWGRARRADPDLVDRLGDATLALRVVVLGPRAASTFGADRLAALEAWVEAGGLLVLDRPPDRMAALSGVRRAGGDGSGGDGSGGDGSARRDGGRSLPARGRFEIALGDDLASGERYAIDLPLPTRVVPVLAEGGTRVVARAAGEPAVFERVVGLGVVQTFAIDLGRFLVAMQQGTPSDDRYGLKKRFGRYDWLIEPEDVVVDESLLDNPVPFADVVEEVLAARWCRVVPQARFWRFPGAKPGAFLMTHDEDLQGGASTLPMAEHEAAEGVTSTFFLIPHPRIHETWKQPVDFYREHEALGVDLQFHWNVLPMPGGFWKVEPWLRRFPIDRQIAYLERDLDRPFANRTHYLILGDHYTRSFRLLEREGIRWDSTYGPNRGGRGYLFATGLPYRPLDTNGQPFELREVPFVTQEDWGGASPEFLARLLRESSDLYHQIVIPIFHPHLIVLEPEGEAFWKRSYRDARDAGAWITDFAGLDEFWTARERSGVRSRFRPESGVLEADFDARGDGMSLRVPARTSAGPFEGARVDGREVDAVRMPAPGGEVVLVPVERGRGQLRVRYATR